MSEFRPDPAKALDHDERRRQVQQALETLIATAAPGDRAGLLRGALAVGDRRAAAGAARHGEDPGATRHAEAARVRCGPSTSSVAHDRPGPGLAAGSRRRLRARRAAGRGGARGSRRSSPTSAEAQREVAEYREVAALLRAGRRGRRASRRTSARGCWRATARRRGRCRPPRGGPEQTSACPGSRSRPACCSPSGSARLWSRREAGWPRSRPRWPRATSTLAETAAAAQRA